jgi:eukaryotic-like serine/threonine-protein kinase
VWDAATGVALGPPLWHRDAVQAVAFAPDGKALLTGGRDRTAQQWEVPAGPVSGSVEQVRLWVRALTGLELDADGTPRRLDDDAVRRLRETLEAPEHAEFVRGVVLP